MTVCWNSDKIERKMLTENFSSIIIARDHYHDSKPCFRASLSISPLSRMSFILKGLEHPAPFLPSPVAPRSTNLVSLQFLHVDHLS